MDNLPYRPTASNEIVRLALFNCDNHTQARAYLRDQKLTTPGDLAVTFTGQELRQDDLDVWLQILHGLRGKSVLEPLVLNSHELLTTMGWHTTVDHYQQLERCLRRMVGTAVTIRYSRLRRLVILPLLAKAELDIDSGLWRLNVSPEILALFGDDRYTRVLEEQRTPLKSLAAKLRLYFAGHDQPLPVAVSSLHQLTGSRIKRLADFRPKLRAALADLVEVGFMEAGEIDAEDRVVVIRRQTGFVG